MSVTVAFHDLATYLANVTGVPAPQRILEDPKETLNLEEFPTIVLCYDWTADHEIQYHADTRSHHRYLVRIYVFVGGQGTPLEELHARIKPWPYAVAHALFPHITLGGDVEFLGNGDKEAFLRYRVGFFNWGGPNEVYFGMRALLVVNEEGIENYQA